MMIGRWLAATHPKITHPASWTRELAAECIAAIDRMQAGQWAVSWKAGAKRRGQPLSARGKAGLITSVRTFFRDCQEWNWIQRRFDPRRAFATPRDIGAQLKPDPRIIADVIWAKLLWAGLNLTEEDLQKHFPQETDKIKPGQSRDPSKREMLWYPLEMMQALVITWLFAGLRSDEIRRLRVGCIRWKHEESPIVGGEEDTVKAAVCYLDVPINKTAPAFTKAVDRIVGEAIKKWEEVRPSQTPVADSKTGELFHPLFAYRGITIGSTYINKSLIPLLCRKAGVEEHDARGTITSHRARATIASQLLNAKEPLSIFELKEWLGHRHVASTQYYAKQSPTKMAKAYEKAGYFGHNLRTIEVLVDQDAIKSGAAANGEPWKFYDLGHGYCAYEFFDQCPHRLVCAKCSFYLPKGSSQAQILEGKANLQRLLQEIPLSEEERAAVEDGILAYDHLLEQLVDRPTPAGPTPRELSIQSEEKRIIIPLQTIQRKRSKPQKQEQEGT
jgi:integrase